MTNLNKLEARLSIQDVCKITGLSKSTITRYCDVDAFPKPRQLIKNGRRFWYQKDIAEWHSKHLSAA